MPLILETIVPPAPTQTPAATNMLANGLAWLTTQLKTVAAQTVTYYSGYSAVEVQAVLGKQLLKLDDGMGGFRMEWTDADFLIASADLTFGDGPVEPARGDLIAIQVGDNVQTFEVTPYGGTEACWRWTDPFQNMLRIHTKLIDLEAYD